MNTRTEIYFLVLVVLLFIFGLVLDTRSTPDKPQVQYDQNGDGVVDIVDMSIAIDTLQRTVEAARGNY